MDLILTTKTYKKFLILLCSFLVAISSCTKKEVKIESISVLFYNYLFETPVAIDCEQIKKDIPSFKTTPIFNQEGDSIEGFFVDNHGVLDTLIVDNKVLNEIEKELENAEWDIYPMSDARISCLLNYNNGTKKKICICGFSSNWLFSENKMMKNSNRLLYIIKKSIGYYHWIHYDMMKNFGELNDTTFVREKVRSYDKKEY